MKPQSPATQTGQPSMTRAWQTNRPIAPPSSTDSQQPFVGDVRPVSGFYIRKKTAAGLALTSVLLVILWSFFVTLTNLGAALNTGLRAAEGISKKAGFAPLDVTIDFEPIRHTKGSILAQDIAMLLTGQGNSGPQGKSVSAAEKMGDVHARSHGPGVVMATQKLFSEINKSCTVRASAEAFDYPQTPMRSLLQGMGGREDAFLLLLAHEMAHCYWSPGPAFEEAIEKQSPETMAQMVSLMPLVINIAESYSDAYALVFSARHDRALFERAYQALIAFRQSARMPAGSYNTIGAITAAAALVTTLPSETSPLSARWDVTHRYVLSSALTGSMDWLMAQGDSREVAIQKIQVALQGQGVEFALRNVADRDYLIVSKAP